MSCWGRAALIRSTAMAARIVCEAAAARMRFSAAGAATPCLATAAEMRWKAMAAGTICGGGRYDDLLGKLGKQKEPAVGFGMGDVVLSLLLDENGLLADAGRIS